jgi:FtsP/CotA-like multicopper oxidase with cupredoxin domain
LLVTNQRARKYTQIVLLGAQAFFATLGWTQTISLPEAPQVRAKKHIVSLTLHAVNENGRDAFAFNGGKVAPVIRASPGDVLRITYINDLPPKSTETCAVNPCMNMTNLHFHGLTVSPNAPQDDVIGMLAINRTGELHPFHIHHVHFLAYAENSVPLAHPAWLDTVNVPYRSSVDVILDFTNPVIKGMSVFHCHLLNHEDKGMMAKILFK